jgi:hypothetical protein
MITPESIFSSLTIVLPLSVYALTAPLPTDVVSSAYEAIGARVDANTADADKIAVIFLFLKKLPPFDKYHAHAYSVRSISASRV